MNLRCTGCEAVYRVDSAKVPAGGVRARCSHCGQVIEVRREPNGVLPAFSVAPPPRAAATEPAPIPAVAPAEPAATAPSGGEPPAPPAFEEPRRADDGLAEGPPAGFGAADPHERARRLARALVSDIVAYHGERRDRGLREGNLRRELGDEIRRSWEEYARKVGNQFARETSYFQEALNEILAPGAGIF